MKKKADIIIDLEENEILPRLKSIKALEGEVDALQKTVNALRQLDEQTIELKEKAQPLSLINYPGYPTDGNLIDKYRFLETKTLKVWSKTEMESLIEQIEGKERAAVTLKSARQKTHYYINLRELIKLKYNNKNTYTFFTTRSEWIERDKDGDKIIFRLLPEHEPEKALLSNLTEEQRKSENICWSGIN